VAAQYSTALALVHTGHQNAMDSWFGRQLDRVDQLFGVYQFQPMDCVYTHPHFEYPCGDPAVASDLETQKPLCAKHSRRVQLDRGLAALEAR
jgi:hypothetical protein